MSRNPWPEGNALFEDGRRSILGVRKVGPYRFAHAKLEEDGIIVKTHIPETGRPNTFLTITSPAPETFLVGLHHEGRDVSEMDVKIVDLLEKQQNDKLLDLEYIQLSVSKLLGLLQKVFGVPGVPGSATNEDTSLPRILVHESLLLFLRDACGTLEPSLNASVQKTLDSYTLSMASNNPVGAILASLEFRKILLELSSKLGLTNNPRLRAAQRQDDQRIAAVLVSIFNSKFEEAAVLGLEGDSAQCFLDVVQSALDKGFLLREDHSRMARRIIRKLSESCDRLPSSLFISGVAGREEYPTFGGGYGDIYRASHNSKPVALKRMRYFLRGADLRRLNLKFCREALVWKDLHHPHILPFLGIDRDSFPSALCMVSPWMEHGTVMDYLKNHGHENVDKLLYEVAQGLQYLHSRNIVHGDLRGGNILVDEEWNACLADFGLSMFTDATSTMTTNRGGSPYWMAPELIDPDRFGRAFARTPTTDVYAFGCVCLELYTGRPPFATLPEPAALMKILNGERPERPVGPPAVSDILWHHISAYWAENPEARPATQLVVQNMKSLYPLVVPNSLSPPAPLSPPMSRSSTPSSLSPVDPHLISPTFADGVSPGPVGDQQIILYDYTGPTDDPNETPISFNEGDTVHVLDQQGMWCEVVKVDGSIGIVPSDCLQTSRSSALTEGSQSAKDHDGNGEHGNIERREGEHRDALAMQFSDLTVVNQSGRNKPLPVLGILHSLDPEQQLEPRAGHLRDKELPEFLLSQGKETVNQTSTTPIHKNFAERNHWVVEQYAPPLRSGTSPEDEVRTKGGFWRFGRKKTEENELTRKIGFLTATASEDWTLVLDVCNHASATEAYAKEAAHALRRDLKYGEPTVQLAAARLWAIILRNSSDAFISQSTSRKFLNTLEDLLVSSRTSPVVRERVMNVLAAAAYASDSKKDAGFRGLWRRVKPRDKPEEGVPFDTEDIMFNPPLIMDGRPSVSVYGHDPGAVNTNDHIISPEEDLRRLFTECKIGVGNANLLSEALAMATPEMLGDAVVVEFHKKCTDSQELIFTQIPWASAGAERSRAAKDQEERERARTRKISANTRNPNGTGPGYEDADESLTDLATPVSTREEELLVDLLTANEQLLEALKLYDDLKRVALEREVEDRSRGELRQYIDEDGTLYADTVGTGGSSSRSRSPSPAPGAARVAVPVSAAPVPMQHPLPSHPGQLEHAVAAYQPTSPPHPQQQQQQQTLAPPPAAPHGPRLPGVVGISRTPSLSPALGVGELANGVSAMHVGGAAVGARGESIRESIDDERREASSYREYDSDEDEDGDPDGQIYQSSAKALGKRRVEADPYDLGQPLDNDLSLPGAERQLRRPARLRRRQ